MKALTGNWRRSDEQELGKQACDGPKLNGKLRAESSGRKLLIT